MTSNRSRDMLTATEAGRKLPAALRLLMRRNGRRLLESSRAIQFEHADVQRLPEEVRRLGTPENYFEAAGRLQQHIEAWLDKRTLPHSKMRASAESEGPDGVLGRGPHTVEADLTARPRRETLIAKAS